MGTCMESSIRQGSKGSIQVKCCVAVHPHSQTQEEVAALQQKLSAAQQRVEEVRTSLSTEHIGATARLQQRNQELIAEVEEMQVGGGGVRLCS
jgi:uncharacterized protein YlxW (UPF0749 family)